MAKLFINIFSTDSDASGYVGIITSKYRPINNTFHMFTEIYERTNNVVGFCIYFIRVTIIRISICIYGRKLDENITSAIIILYCLCVT